MEKRLLSQCGTYNNPVTVEVFQKMIIHAVRKGVT